MKNFLLNPDLAKLSLLSSVEDGAAGGGDSSGDGKPPAGDETGGEKSGGDSSDDGEEGTDWKAKARLWEKRAKENLKAKEEVDRLENEKKSELQKAIDRAEKAEQEATALREAQERERDRLAVAAAHELPATVLTHGTKEELEAAAKAIKALIGESQSNKKQEKYGSNGSGEKNAGSSINAGRELHAQTTKKRSKE